MNGKYQALAHQTPEYDFIIFQIEAINGTVHIFKPWFLKDIADFG